METTALRVNEMGIAFEIAVRRESYYGFFHIAHLPDYHKHAPGRQLMLHNIERAMSKGYTGFDFLQGGHEYKQKLCTGSLELMDAFICQRSLDGRLNHWLSRLVRRLRGAPKPQHQPRDEKQQHRAQFERPHQKVHGQSRVVFKLNHIISCNPEEFGVKADDKLIRKYHRQKPQQEEPKRHQKNPETKLLRRPTALI